MSNRKKNMVYAYDEHGVLLGEAKIEAARNLKHRVGALWYAGIENFEYLVMHDAPYAEKSDMCGRLISTWELDENDIRIPETLHKFNLK